MSVSTHVLDTTTGRPAEGVAARLARGTADGWTPAGAATTDADGRIARLLSGGALAAGVYRLTFDVGGYFASGGVEAFYPEVSIVFRVTDPTRHHHVPLLLSPFGYTTYRGS